MLEVTSIHGSHEMITHISKYNFQSCECSAAHYQNNVNKVMISSPSREARLVEAPRNTLTFIGSKNRETQQVIWKQKLLQKVLPDTV